MTKTRVGLLISGGGSNMEALIRAMRGSGYPAEPVLVISNRPQAGGIEKARVAGVETMVIDHKAYGGRQDFEAAIHNALKSHDVELVCLAGFMRILTPWFIERWPNRILNIHPALLPSYKGLHTHERALADGVKLHGATVHFVRPDMDAGPIVAQGVVSVLAEDTPETLAARVLKVEHRIYPLAVALVASGQAVVTRRADGTEIVAISGEDARAESLIAPGIHIG